MCFSAGSAAATGCHGRLRDLAKHAEEMRFSADGAAATGCLGRLRDLATHAKGWL